MLLNSSHPFSQIFTLTFINQRKDLRFVFKFRKISKFCKSYSEEWLTIIDDKYFLRNVDVTQFKNLQKLKCSINITDKDLQQLHKLKWLKLPRFSNVTNDGISHLDLDALYISENSYITDAAITKMNLTTLITKDVGITNAGIAHMTKLRKLGCRTNPRITDEGIKHRQLYYLNANNNPHITDAGIANMLKTLRVLYMNGTCGITYKSLKCLNLDKLEVSLNKEITDDAIEHMDLVALYACGDIQITGRSVTKMNRLRTLSILDNPFFEDEHIKHLKLRKLYADFTSISNDGIEDMDLLVLHNNGGIIDDESVKKMINLVELSVDENTFVTDNGIMHLHKLRKLYCNNNEEITDIGIRDKKLTHLDCGLNRSITDEGIADMKLLKLWIENFSGITDLGLSKQDLYALYMNRNDEISDKGIKTMKNLAILFRCFGDSRVTDAGLINLNLSLLVVYSNSSFTTAGTTHMTNCTCYF